MPLLYMVNNTLPPLDLHLHHQQQHLYRLKTFNMLIPISIRQLLEAAAAVVVVVAEITDLSLNMDSVVLIFPLQ
jgi:hypothetical protein